MERKTRCEGNRQCRARQPAFDFEERSFICDGREAGFLGSRSQCQGYSPPKVPPVIDIHAELRAFSEKLMDVSIWLNSPHPFKLSANERVLANQLALHHCRLAIDLRSSGTGFESLSDLVFDAGAGLFGSLEYAELLPDWAQILEAPMVQRLPHWKYRVLAATMSMPSLRLKHILEALNLNLSKDYKMYRQGMLECAMDGGIPLSPSEREKLAQTLLTQAWDAENINTKLKIKKQARKILRQKEGATENP